MANAIVNYETRSNAFVGHAPGGAANITDEGSAPQVDATGVRIEAAGDFRMAAVTDAIPEATASAVGGGFISVSSAAGNNTLTARTNAIFGSGATVDARTVDVLAQGRNLLPTARSQAIAGGFAGGATAHANNAVTSSTLVLLEGTADRLTSITGRRGMDLEATHTNVVTKREPDGRWYGLFGGASGPGNNTGTVSNLIDGDAGVVVTVAPRPGTATSGAAQPSPLDAVSGFNSLSLLAKANNGTITGINGGTVQEDRRKVQWDSDIVVGAGPAPELFVRADGTIDRAICHGQRYAKPGAEFGNRIPDRSRRHR